MAIEQRDALRELGSRYEETRGRIFGLVAQLDDAAAVSVPACPGWSVHNLISHMTGNCVDVMNGNLQGLATDPWTAAQVDARSERTTSAVLDEWNEVAPQFAAMIDDFPGRYGEMAVGDTTVHEHDLRGAVGEPGQRESDSVVQVTDFLLTAIAHSAMTAFGVGPLEVHAGSRSWVVGTGELASGDSDAWLAAIQSSERPAVKGRPVGTLTADLFELFRALTGRRSAAQIRRFGWSLDPEPFVPAFGYGPFTLRDADLIE